MLQQKCTQGNNLSTRERSKEGTKVSTNEIHGFYIFGIEIWNKKFIPMFFPVFEQKT